MKGLESATGEYAFGTSQPVLDAEGDPLDNLPEDQINERSQVDTICTHQHAVDYDGDGDLDLVVGSFGQNLFFYENLANDAQVEPQLAKPQAMGISMPANHGAPHFVDFDGDDDLDLLTGTVNGGVFIAHNLGTKDKPRYGKFEEMVPTSQLHQQAPAEDQQIKMAPSTRVWVVDFNRDGLLDLLVGDSTTINHRQPGLDDEAYLRMKQKYEKDIAAISEARNKFYQENGEALQAGGEPSEEIANQAKALNTEFMRILDSKKEFDSSVQTGFVWLLLQTKHED